MILNGKKLKNTPFKDSRGHAGESGQLHIAETSNGIKYLVKSNPADVTNEFVVHRIAKIIGVPTSNAVLIIEGDIVEVGIEYEKDFKRVSMDDFIGNLVYPDDSPFLADLMSYLALRDLVKMGDNHQLALSKNRLISFDYADSFNFSDTSYRIMCMMKDNSLSISAFSKLYSLPLELDYIFETFKRQKTDFLIDAYCDTIFGFMDADLTPILNDLKEVFPPVISGFYESCFDVIKKTINKLGE